jgi:hypothetical protein
MKICAAIRILRRSNVSASAPAASASIITGSVVDAWTRLTMTGESAIDIIIHAAPTDWTIPPNCDHRLASQTLRKMA